MSFSHHLSSKLRKKNTNLIISHHFPFPFSQFPSYGQSSSSLSPSPSPPKSTHHHHCRHISTTITSPSSSSRSEFNFSDLLTSSYIDYTSEIPDDCLAIVFQFLTSVDRKRCSLGSRRWLLVEGQSRHCLSLTAQSEIVSFIPSIFSRFDSVTKLSLRCDRRSVSITIDDNGLILISLRCPKLTRLKLRGCREITELGMAELGQNCKDLKKFSCGSCMFGAKGLNAFLNNCFSLEELSVKRLRGVNDGEAEPIGPGAAVSLKSIYLKELYYGQLFGLLIGRAKN